MTDPQPQSPAMSHHRSTQPSTNPTCQRDVIAFLADPESWSPRPATVEHIETHGAHVFLANDRAIKIKRCVAFSYMDFSTLEKRHAAALRETEINRAFSPELYLGTVPIMRGPTGAFSLGGSGTPVEWAIVMRRFAQSALLSQIVRTSGLPTTLVKALARTVHASHRAAVPARPADPAGRLQHIAESTVAELVASDPSRAETAIAFGRHATARLGEQRGRLAQRRDQGRIRRCHGDLHLNNIALIDGAPRLFDALEFDEDLATIDTLYDLAFLLMDLDAAGARASANALLGHYLWLTDDPDELAALRLLGPFMAIRAAIRALVGAQRARQVSAAPPHAGTPGLLRTPQGHLGLAMDYLAPPAPSLVAVGGFSGTGKSTLAGALAPGFGAAPGALHLRSDLERKAMFGASETERLPPEAYAIDVTRRVYDRLAANAATALRAGHSVIVDAVFSTPAERAAIEAVAEATGAAFTGLWLTAPADVMTSRIAARTGDASDATPDVAMTQIARGTGTLAWHIVDAGGSPPEVHARAAPLIRTT